jgi:hypothetical protein
MKKSLIIAENIESKIFLIRNQKVMLDFNLAELYEIETRVLKQAVRRNIERFPSDFMFQLALNEYRSIRSQNVILKKGQHSKYLPFAFLEQGVAMLSTVLKSKKAILVNIEIMRAFVKIREIISTHKELANRLKELELKVDVHDENIAQIFEVIKQLLKPPEKQTGKIGF